MFQPKTERLKQLAKKYPNRIAEHEKFFDKPTNIYIDFANVFRWQEKLRWHIDLKRLKQLFNSFYTVREVKFYQGTVLGNEKSEKFIENVKNYGYLVGTKPVKVMRLSIDVSSISPDSPEILRQFIKYPLLQRIGQKTIRLLNNRLKELNKQGIMYIEDLKCNFDVEIGRDMLLDYHERRADNFILWSGDSDFMDPIRQLLNDGKKVILFATARMVSVELSQLRESGLFIFDIQKIKEFICWKKEIS